MAELQPGDFLALLKKSGLLTPQQIESAQSLATKSTGDSGDLKAATASLAAELVRAQLITQWQANQLLKGQTGFVLQQYRLLMPVGRGGMGHVFKARDTSKGTIVAIKVMSRKLTGNQTLVNRFRREIRASSLLSSPYIVRTLDAGRVGKVDFMVMEYVNGDQVDRIVSRVSAMPVAMACDVIRQAAIGLQHAHEQKMVHRDLKPGNLIVDWSSDGKGTVKIMDMGLVRLGTDGEERTSVTKAGQVMGTPDYMSPEQGWDTATVDIRSDIYSLGCTLFRLLTGRVPFPGDNPLQVLMARCSKDAPSVKSHRNDIPEPVDAIVRRMTLRDPAGRFQSPQELIAALEPFSSPLTITGLRIALKEAGDDDAILLEVANAVDSGEPQDAGYQQFLREMDSGAAVDMMLSTNAGQGQALNPTLPVLSQTDRRVSGTRRTPSKSSNTAGVLALSSASAVVALLALFLFVNRGDDRTNQPNQASLVDGATQKTANTTQPVAKLAEATPVSIHAGELLTYLPQFVGEKPAVSASGELKFQLGSGTPAGVTIDPKSGEIRWDIPKEQASAPYEIPIELTFQNAGKSSLIASTLLIAKVEAGLPRYSFVDREPLMIRPGEPLQMTVQASPKPDANSSLEYRLGQGQLPGMNLDPASGLFSWTPDGDEAGRNIVSVQLYDTAEQKTIATGSIVVLVRPTLKLPSFPEQMAIAGTEFKLQLMEKPPRFLGRAFRLGIKEGSPTGVSIDPRRGTLSWKVPADTVGRFEIRVVLESLLPNFEFSAEEQRETLIVVNVEGKTPDSQVPAEAEIDAAEAELRELLKRDLAAAKSTAERIALANQILERCEEQETGATDYAMLNLVEEVAEKARATDVGLRAVQIRSVRYGTPELDAGKSLAENFRLNSISAAQVDGTIENFLRLAFVAAGEARYADVALLLGPPEQLIRKQDKNALVKLLSDDISNCIQLAEGLSAEGAVVTGELKISQLSRLLQRWQFKDLFGDTSVLSYVSSGSGLADSGRSLWKFEKGKIQLTASPRNLSIGILDPTQDVSRYLLRMQMSAETTAAMLILGAGREQNLNAHLLTLDKSEFGRVISTPGGTNLVSQATGVTLPNTGWSSLEILVDNALLAVRVNGVAVSSSQLPALKPGRLGLLVPLERSAMPRMDIRHARILILPDSAAN